MYLFHGLLFQFRHQALKEKIHVCDNVFPSREFRFFTLCISRERGNYSERVLRLYGRFVLLLLELRLIGTKQRGQFAPFRERKFGDVHRDCCVEEGKITSVESLGCLFAQGSQDFLGVVCGRGVFDHSAPYYKLWYNISRPKNEISQFPLDRKSVV